MSAVPPLMVKTATNPGGLPIEVFDAIRKGTYDNRSQFYKDLAVPFYGYNREGAKLSEGVRDSFWLQGMMGGLKAQLDYIKAFSEIDFTDNLAKFDIPTLVAQGDDDQIVPLDNSGRISAKLIPNATLKIYPGAPHGLFTTMQDQFNADLIGFIRA